jgi:hypothetical protein
MDAARTDAPEKPGTRIRGKRFWMITGIIIGIVVIVILAFFIIFLAPGNNENTLNPVATTSPAQLQVSTTFLPEQSSTIGQSGTYTVETSKLPVDFVLRSGAPVSCGLTCRQLDATIANTGFETAHNVCITVALHNSRNDLINLNGDPFIRRCIGDIAGGESKTEPISVNADCGAFATKCIGETLTLQTQVSSDEKTTQLPDQLIAV